MQKIIVNPIQSIDNKALEEIKRLRTSIYFLKTNIKVINITSTVGKEGKSLISFWLAHTLADMGKKVILVDGNLRKKEKVNTFYINTADENKADEKIANKKEKRKSKVFAAGTTNSFLSGKTLKKYLTGKVRKEDIIYESNINNLHFILSGDAPDNPSELLSDISLSALINYLKENYDYIIIDTPAVGEVTDGIIIASHCEGSILVVEPGVTPYQLAQKAVKQLENSGSQLLGVVLNKV